MSRLLWKRASLPTTILLLQSVIESFDLNFRRSTGIGTWQQLHACSTVERKYSEYSFPIKKKKSIGDVKSEKFKKHNHNTHIYTCTHLYGHAFIVHRRFANRTQCVLHIGTRTDTEYISSTRCVILFYYFFFFFVRIYILLCTYKR